MRHLVIPDVQAKPGHDFSYLTKIGQYIVEKKPDKLICLGDFADMPSLSSYDIGKKSFEGRRYMADIEASQEAMVALLKPMWDFNARAKRFKEKQYKPEMHLVLGNHENRINRAINDSPQQKLSDMLILAGPSIPSLMWLLLTVLLIVTTLPRELWDDQLLQPLLALLRSI